MNLPGIYVEIRGDYDKLQKDLQQARKLVWEQAKGMSNALNNALSPAQIAGGINDLTKNLSKLERASKVVGKNFEDISADLQELGKKTGLTDQKFASLQQRMMQTRAAKTQERALLDIARAANLSEKEIRELGKQFNLSNSSIDKVVGSTQKASTSMLTLGNAVKTAIAYFSVYEVAAFAKSAFDASIAIDMWQRSMVAITGSQQAMAMEMEFLRATAERTGQNFYTLTDDYRKLAAATKATGISVADTQKVFSSVAEAGAVLGLSSVRVSYALEAMSQMASKGTVSLEELRRQLGDHIPGAMAIAAKAMGVPVSELMRMIENGEVLAEDLLPKLADELHNLYGEAAQTAALDSGMAAVNRLSEAWTDFKVNLVDSELAVAGIKSITTALEYLNGFLTNKGNPAMDSMFGGELFSAGMREDNLTGYLTQSLANLEGQIQLNIDAIKRLNEANGGIADNEGQKAIDTLVAKNEELRSKVEAVTVQLDMVRSLGLKTYDDLSAAMGDPIKAAAELQSALEHQTNYMREFGNGVKDLTSEQVNLQSELTDKIAKLTKSTYEYKKFALEREVADLKKQAEHRAEIVDQIEEYYRESLKSIEKEYREHQQRLTKKAEEEAKRRTEKVIKEIDAMFKREADQAAEAYKQMAEAVNNELDSLMTHSAPELFGFGKKIKGETDDFTEYMQDRWKNAYKGMQDVLADFVRTGEFSFDSIKDLFLDMLAEMTAAWLMNVGKMAVIDLFSGEGFSGVKSALSLSSLLSEDSGGSGGGSGGGGSGGGVSSAITAASMAKGLSKYFGGKTITSLSGKTVPLGSGGTTGGATGGATGGSSGSGATAGLAAGSVGMLGALAGFAAIAAWSYANKKPRLTTQASNGSFVTVDDRDENGRIDLSDLTFSLDTLQTKFDDLTFSGLETSETVDRMVDRLDVMAFQFGDTVAQFGLALDGSLPSTEAFISSLTGYRVSLEQASEMHYLAGLAATGTAGASDILRDKLEDLGISGGEATTAISAMIAKVNDLSSTPLDIKINVQQQIQRSYTPFHPVPGTDGAYASGDRIPSYDVGTPYVPNDGLAYLHKGERVLTADENKSFSQPQQIVIPVNVGGRELDRIVVDIADGHIVARNSAGIDPLQRAV